MSLEEAIEVYWATSNMSTLNDKLAAFNAVIAAEPENAEAYAYRGSVYRIMKDFDAAERDIETALALAPTSPLVLCLWGRLLMETERQMEGIQILAYAADRAPFDSVVLFQLANGILLLGDPVAAVEYFERAIEIDSSRASYFSAMAIAYDRGGLGPLYDVAAKAVALDPTDATGYFYMARARWLTHPEEALEYATLAIHYEPSAINYNLRGTVYYLLGQYENALADFRRTVKMNDEIINAKRNLALTLEQLGEQEEALSWAGQFTDSPGTLAKLRFAAGDFYEDLHQYDLALSNYEEAHELEPMWYDAAFQLGHLHYALSDYKLAVEYLTVAIGISQDDFRPYWERAFANRRLALETWPMDFSVVLEDMERVVELEPLVPLYWYELGQAQESNSLYGEALKSYSRAIELSPYYGAAYEARALLGRMYPDLAVNVDEDIEMACMLGSGFMFNCP